jgi:CHAD domain-containing protein
MDLLHPDLPAPARLAARVVAGARLDAVRSAFEKLDADTPDSLHDLRVALRRLRSWIRAYRRQLGDTVRKKTRRRLDKVARVTDTARDVEVFIAWIGKQTDLPPRARRGSRFIADRLVRERDRAMGGVHDGVAERLPDTLDALGEQFGRYWRRVDVGRDRHEATMASVTVDLVRQLYRQFRRRLSRIESGDDGAAIHRTRIAAKKLRYLLESLDQFPGVADLCEQLADLQDMLGACHDSDVFIARLVDEIVGLAAADARRRARVSVGLTSIDDEDSLPALTRVRAGIVELAVRSRREHDAAYQRFQELWTPAIIDSATRVIDGLAVELEIM